MSGFLVIFLAVVSTDAQVIFSQNFSSTTLSDYISTTPDSGQWNAIGSSGAGVTLSVSGNNLSYTRSAANVGSFSRTTDFSPAPAALEYIFDLSVSGNTSATTSAAVWQIGSFFSTNNSAEINADVYARFALNFTATDGTFVIRDITNGTNSASFSGTQTIMWVLNNSGSSVSYINPSATGSSLANDTADLWIGTTLVFDDVAVQTADQILTDLKFAFSAGSGTITMDNFSITAIPEPSTYAFFGGLAVLGLVARRRKTRLGR